MYVSKSTEDPPLRKVCFKGFGDLEPGRNHCLCTAQTFPIERPKLLNMNGNKGRKVPTGMKG